MKVEPSQHTGEAIRRFNALRGQEGDQWVAIQVVRAVSAQLLLCVPQDRRSGSNGSVGTTSNASWASVNHAS